MLTVEQCRKILNKQAKTKKQQEYTDAEITQIRDFLYHLAKMDLDCFVKQKKEGK